MDRASPPLQREPAIATSGAPAGTAPRWPPRDQQSMSLPPSASTASDSSAKLRHYLTPPHRKARAHRRKARKPHGIGRKTQR